MNEAELSARFQAFAEADTSAGARRLLENADEDDMPLLEYIAETGPEIREILDRMMIATKFPIQQR